MRGRRCQIVAIHEITFPDSIVFIIQVMPPGNDIFDKTEEIREVPKCLEAVAKNSVSWMIQFSTSTFGLLQLREAAHVGKPSGWGLHLHLEAG